MDSRKLQKYDGRHRLVEQSKNEVDESLNTPEPAGYMTYILYDFEHFDKVKKLILRRTNI